MITATFTDPQGAVQTDAVICLRTATHRATSREHFLLDPSDFATVNNPAPDVSNHINCSFYYWVNQAAKDNGAAPYILANSAQMDMDFSFSPDATYDGLTLEEKCEKYLVDVILPPMQGA